MLHRTCRVPVHFITQPPQGNRRLGTPSKIEWKSRVAQDQGNQCMAGCACTCAGLKYFGLLRPGHATYVIDLYSYLLGLLAMIKCSICSYQCDNWYVSNWRLACHINFSLGRCPLELAQGPSRVALAWHKAGSSTPFGVTMTFSWTWLHKFLFALVEAFRKMLCVACVRLGMLSCVGSDWISWLVWRALYWPRLATHSDQHERAWETQAETT